MELPKGFKQYDIWVGWYHLGQGYDPPTAPEKLATIAARTFQFACIKYELYRTLEAVEKTEAENGYTGNGFMSWNYSWDKNSNSWTGKYFETEEEAWQTFKQR